MGEQNRAADRKRTLSNGALLRELDAVGDHGTVEVV